jgi:uncharacterized protein (DUF885 family)
VAGGDTLDTLAERLWDVVCEQYPVVASLFGDHRQGDRLPDLSEDAEARWRDELASIRDAARRLDGTLARDLVVWRAEYGLTQADWDVRGLWYDPFSGHHATVIEWLPQVHLPDAAAVQGHLARLADVPRFLDEALTRFRAALAAGRPPARAPLARVVNQLEGYLALPLDADPLLKPLPSEHRDDAVARIRDHVRPGVQRHRDGVVADLLPAARPDERPGLCWGDDGAELYGVLAGQHTTTDVDPDALHASGREEVEGALRDELVTLAGPLVGDDDFSAIRDRLRTDTALHFADPDEVLAVARACVERAEAVQDRWFGRLPRSGCLVEPVPDYLAADASVAYYLAPTPDGSRPGTYWVNLRDPAALTRYEAEAIAFHEAIPGHHLQRALATEDTGLTQFRRQLPALAYLEGWGLYAERLADEMGLYSEGWARVGMPVADAWRAGRLVVDTGLHALGWSREQAIGYLAEHTAQPLAEIEVEIDRYIGWPGQALAYKVGQRAITGLRAEAETALGDRFDVRAFHDEVLRHGPLPLDLLQRTLHVWAHR